MTELIAVRLTREMRQEIDDWRSKVRPIPSQGAAIRQLVQDALDLHNKGAGEAKAKGKGKQS